MKTGVWSIVRDSVKYKRRPAKPREWLTAISICADRPAHNTVRPICAAGGERTSAARNWRRRALGGASAIYRVPGDARHEAKLAEPASPDCDDL